MSDSAPAPWKAVKRRTAQGRVVVFVEDCEGGTVAVCDDYHRGDPQNYELGCAIAALPDFRDVAKELDDFQRDYEVKAMCPGGMPGNDLYCEKLMVIVRHARATLTKVIGETP